MSPATRNRSPNYQPAGGSRTGIDSTMCFSGSLLSGDRQFLRDLHYMVYVDGFQFHRRLYSLYLLLGIPIRIQIGTGSLSLSACVCVCVYCSACCHARPALLCCRPSHGLSPVAQRRAWPHPSWQFVSRGISTLAHSTSPHQIAIRQTSDRHTTLLLLSHGLKRPSRFRSYQLR